jgi:pyruvate ferredoxin oxidoreductase gamma subunit
MYRIRFHGRGGQGIKTASRILGRAFFIEGFEVQDAPRYGAERRGAPISAYVRADRRPIHKRGVIIQPDLVLVADDTLLAVPVAGILSGCTDRTVMILHSRDSATDWKQRLNVAGPVVTLPHEEESAFVGVRCVGAAVRLVGVIGKEALAAAIRLELGHLASDVLDANLDAANRAYEALAGFSERVNPSEEVMAGEYLTPHWIDLPLEPVELAAPAIHAGATSEMVETGLWRTERPEIDWDRCRHCWWLCSTYCPEGAISIDEEQRPHIDYRHCKGCMICLAQCPGHAITARQESGGQPGGGESQ